MYSIYVQPWSGYAAGGSDGKVLLFFPGLAETDETRRVTGYAVLSPRVEKEVDKAGSFSCIIPPTNPSYNVCARGAMVFVMQDEEEIFRGRILYTEVDFYKKKKIYVEGLLSFFSDTVMSPVTYSGTTSTAIFTALVAAHNGMKSPGATPGTAGTFIVGDTPSTVISNMTFEIGDYTTTIDAMMKLVNNSEAAGTGNLRTRIEGGLQYIDWVSFDNGGQDIEFAKNILDLTDYITAEDVWTIILPLGKENLTIGSVYGSNTVEDVPGISAWGRIMHIETWGDIEDPSELLSKAQTALSVQTVDRSISTLEISAVDLHLLDVDIDSIDIAKRYRVKSQPHGIDITMMCSKVKVDLQNPKKSMYYFGAKRKSLTDQVGGR